MKHIIHNKKGNKYSKLGQFDLAIKCYDLSLSIKPEYVEAHYNLGYSYHMIGQLDLAVRSYKKVVKIDPSYAFKHSNKILSVIYFFIEGQVPDAIDTLTLLIQDNPDDAMLYNMLGGCYTSSNQIEMAIQSYKRALALKSDYAVPQHMLNSLTGHTSKEPPKEYVRNLFDDYAESFDASLLEHLEYKLPFMIKELILQLDPTKEEFDKVLDLGCGTGLSGNHLKDISVNLTGIDISENMISKAKELDLYDNLIVGDIVETLNSSKENFDLFIALDVLIYIGELESIIKAVRQRCNKDAVFIFSVEIQDKGFSLLKNARYAHSDGYILETSNNIFELIKSKNIKLRKERGEWIKGKVYVLRAS